MAFKAVTAAAASGSNVSADKDRSEILACVPDVHFRCRDVGRVARCVQTFVVQECHIADEYGLTREERANAAAGRIRKRLGLSDRDITSLRVRKDGGSERMLRAPFRDRGQAEQKVRHHAGDWNHGAHFGRTARHGSRFVENNGPLSGTKRGAPAQSFRLSA
jgi:hypothetical protein